jgi:FkbM family methyltransferase
VALHDLGVSPKVFGMDDLRSLLIGLIGYSFGHEPETKIREIRDSRRDWANSIADIAGINSTDVVLDLRSGCGFATYWFAQRAKHVHACDVSSAYLQFAKNECRDVSNITFHQIEPRSLSPVADNSIDVVCSMSVFIHFNLYDIYWNFQELARVTKPRARVWIDIADSESIEFDNQNVSAKYFLNHANAYKKEPESISGLMQWNSIEAVVKMASHFGFKPVHKDTGTNMLFQKGMDDLRASFYSAPDPVRGSFFEFVIHSCIRELCLPGTTAIDVGANGGAHTRTMAQAVGASGHVHAFEPDPRILRDMLMPLREEFPWVHLHPIALSDGNGTLPFYLDKSTALSSLHVRPNHGMQVVEKIEMPVRRLDDVPEIATADRISLIKADVEGEELRFVAGAAATMRKHQPIVLLEIDWPHVFNATAVRSAAGDHERDVQQFLSRLRDNGYSVMDFFGESIEHYDRHAWNVALVPDSCDRTLLARILRNAAALFFNEHQDWSLYGVTKALESQIAEHSRIRELKSQIATLVLKIGRVLRRFTGQAIPY